VKILAVNIRAGGSQATVEAMAARCLAHEPDCVVLSEFRDNPVGTIASRRLGNAGLAHQAHSSHRRSNGVLLAARDEFRSIQNPFGLSDDEYPDAIIEGIFADLRLFGVYLPGQDRKRPHLRCLISTAQHFNQAGVAALCIGDFNSGRNDTDIEQNLGRARLADEFSTADLYAELEQYWTEAWLYCNPGRHEFSWYPFRVADGVRRKSGWRIDKAFVSRALLPRLRSANYDHGFRTERLSDHSALVVELQ
jgi:exodeoxyribonuclease III